MAETLESLEIEVKHSATGAASEIGKVASAVNKLASALGRALPNLKVFKDIMGDGQINIANNGTTQIANSITNVSQAASKAKQSTSDAAKGIQAMAKAAKKTQSPLGNFLSSLKRIAFYRFIRSIIKGITSAFTEGLQKAYLFSAGIATSGHRFAVALDEMKSRSNQMKGQMGSAFMSLLTAIQPILLKVIDIITRAADAVSQFFAAFTGKTYVRAVATTAQFADTTAKGAKSAKEWKNQLLGFDEINRLEAPSDGGGGSGENPLAGYSFKDTPIDEKYLEAAEKVKDVLQWIQDHMDLIKGLAIGIGAALLTWKIVNLVPSLSKLLGGINGVTLGVSLLVGGFAALAYGLYQWISTGELTSSTFWLIEAGIMAVGVGLSLLTGSWIPLVIAGAVALAFALITQFDKIKAKLEEWSKSLSQHLGNGRLEWQDFAAVAVNSILWVINAVQSVISWIQSMVAWIRNAIDWFNQLSFVRQANANAQRIQNNGSIYLQGFAEGGYPSEGQLFVARESGAEMVGSIGGRTAVATNDDIVAAVSQGVYQAVASAMSTSNSGGGVTEISIDGRKLAEVLYPYNKAVSARHGSNLITEM